MKTFSGSFWVCLFFDNLYTNLQECNCLLGFDNIGHSTWENLALTILSG